MDVDGNSVASKLPQLSTKTVKLFSDSHTEEERTRILTSLLENPSEQDLRELSYDESSLKLRELALSPNTVNEVKRFDTAFRQSLLFLQHQIVTLEEEMSQPKREDQVMRLSHLLIDYSEIVLKSLLCLIQRLTIIAASLVKSYRELLSMKQPEQSESRRVSKLLATQLHEPRYWYAPDAFNLIDLRVEETKGSHDIVRKFLQQTVPPSFLDEVGTERRKIDDIEARKKLPFGKSLILNLNHSASLAISETAS